jgi:hypothetical protein
MTPGDRARESKLIRIAKEVEVKINFAGEFHDACVVCMLDRGATTPLERLEDCVEDG